MLFLITYWERQRSEGLQLLHDPPGFHFWTTEHWQIEHLLQHNSPHTVLKIIVNILSIILPTWVLRPTCGMLYIMRIYTSYQACREQNSHSYIVHETICICRMSAPLEWEITHIMWLQALVLLLRVKCCDPDHAHQCWCPHDYRWGLNTLVFILSGCEFFFFFLLHI